MDRCIDFVIIGAQKCGTSALHRYLGLHPQIFTPRIKENAFFRDEEAFSRGPAFLAPFFRGLGEEPVVGMTNVGILYTPFSWQRIHLYNPAMKLVVLLRDPVERAWSAFWYCKRIGWEPAETLEQALDREEASPPPRTMVERARSYLRNGRYAEQLRPFLARFHRDQVRVLFSAHLAADARSVIEDLCQWLGVAPEALQADLTERHNPASISRFPRLQRVIWAPDSRTKRLYRSMVPRRLRTAVSLRVIRPLMDRTQRPFTKPPLDPDTRRRLERYYRPHDRALLEMLDRESLPWHPRSPQPSPPPPGEATETSEPPGAVRISEDLPQPRASSSLPPSSLPPSSLGSEETAP